MKPMSLDTEDHARSAALHAVPARRPSDAIGSILIEAGMLDAERVARILLAQREHGLRFGDAAVKLKLLSTADIEGALARQFGYPYLRGPQSPLAPELVSAFQPFGTAAEQIRSLRTRLHMHRSATPGLPPTVAILSAEAGDGRSFIAANLAIAFAQMGERTLLIDADLRRPRQHALFKLQSRQGLSNLLLGRSESDCITRIPDFLDLSVLGAGSPPPNPQELLTRLRMSSLLEHAANDYDIVIVDTPPAASCADAQILATRVGMNVVVARRNRSNANHLRRLLDSLRECSASVVGSVFNDR